MEAERCAGGLERAGYLVTADDFGKVKLFNYPCVYNDAPYREYKGHASHAMSIRFSCDDRRVFTAGGHDRAVLQFKTKGIRQDEEPPAYTPPPEPKRTWGPIDGGKAYGWIEEVRFLLFPYGQLVIDVYMFCLGASIFAIDTQGSAQGVRGRRLRGGSLALEVRG